MKKRSVPFIQLLAGGLLMLTSACEENSVFQEMERIEGKHWEAKDTVTIGFEVQDTVAPHDLYLKVRNNTNYPFRNIYFFLSIEFPNGKQWRDTVECKLADGKGNWTGSGIGNIKDHSFLFIHKKRFPLKGEHEFNIVHAMRRKKLPGIEDVGLGIERIPEKER